MSTIPANAIVDVTPSVLGTGGAGLDLIALLMSTAARVPIGTVQAFASADDVEDYFGASSVEAENAAVYFLGFENADTRPGSVLFAQYNEDDVVAFIRGGSLAAMTLTQLQAINASMSISIDGVAETGTINLSTASSFSNAALLIQDQLGIDGIQAAAFTGSISTTTLTVSAVGSGVLAVGQVLHGVGVTAQTYITAFGSGTGGTGTYTVSDSQTVGSISMTADEPAVVFDSVSSAFVIKSGTDGDASTIAFATGSAATSLKLTSATGAVLSQGADAADPMTFMDMISDVTQNWATFAFLFNPDASGFVNRLALAEWTNLQDDQYAFACWDDDAAAAASVPATSTLGYAIQQAAYAGTILIYADDPKYAVFECAIAASIDFTQPNSRTTYAFRKQDGLAATIETETGASNLSQNGYNYYGAYATARNEYSFLYPGQISGQYRWADSYINQLWLNSSFQETLLVFLQTVKSIPYNNAGYTQIQNACSDVITAALNFGAIRTGVPLSAAQAATVNAEAGLRISDTLFTQGWYLQVLPADATVRAARGSPPMKFWYMDGQSIQRIDLASVNIQ